MIGPDGWTLWAGDNRDLMANMGDNTVDAVVTDPPYELTSVVKRYGGPNAAPQQYGSDGAFARAARGFMGQTWDGTGIAFDPAFWAEVLRVLKPGGHLLAFGGSRTYHRMAVAIEDAGFEIRDQIMWLYGSGFPKSHDVSKGIDKAAGAERAQGAARLLPNGREHHFNIGFGEGEGFKSQKSGRFSTIPATDAARKWSGWGTALKPAHEPIVLARKPLVGTVAQNVLTHGTGAINVDGCRVEAQGRPLIESRAEKSLNAFGDGINGSRAAGTTNQGRWPANIIHDGSEEVVGSFPSERPSRGGSAKRKTASQKTTVYGDFCGGTEKVVRNDAGSAARFFYCAKASKADREEGCDLLDARPAGMVSENSGQHITRREPDYVPPSRRNPHPTVKPENLMRYLCRLITPPDGLVFDPFAGSGSTGKAALREGFRFLGAEMTPEYVPVARARLTAASTARNPARKEPI